MQNGKLSNSVGATAKSSVQSLNLVKRLLNTYSVVTKRIASDLSYMSKLEVVPISTEIKNRVGNFYPVRIFWPTARVMIGSKLISRVYLESQTASVNNKTSFETDVLDLVSRTACESRVIKLDRSILYKALRLAFSFVFPGSIPRLTPLRDYRELLSLTNWSANSGYPHLVKKNKLVGEYTTKLRSWLSGKLDLRSFLNYPCIVFNRVQAKGGKLKRRAVYGYPFIFSLIEQVYYHPIVNYLRDNRTIVLGKRQIEIAESLSALKGYHVYSFDYSKFDLRVQPVFIYLTFEVFLSMLHVTQFELEQLRVITKYFCFSRYYHPRFGTLIRRQGVPSGSGGTNLIDSFVNLIATMYTVVLAGYSGQLKAVRIHGDDIVLAFDEQINPSKLVRYSEKVGMVLTFEDGMYYPAGTEGAHFLGSEWRNGKPYRDETTMALSVSTISGVLEKARTLEDAVEGYIYSVFGYDCRFNSFWRRFKLRPLSNRMVFLYPKGFQHWMPYAKDQTPHYTKMSFEPWTTR